MRQQPWYEQCNWIWLDGYDDTAPEGKIVLFRRKFNLEETPSLPCIIKVSGDTRYRFYVNGISVSVGPCKSYPSRWYYETVDMSPYLKVGQNVLSARVLRFSNVHAGSMSLMRGPFPGLIVHCNINDSNLHSDTAWEARLDDSVKMSSRSEWNYALGPPFLVLNEHVDSNLTELDWHTSDSKKWSSAKLMSSKSMMLPVLDPWKLKERSIPALPEIETRFRKAVKCSGPITISKWSEFIQKDAILEIPPSTTTSVDFDVSKLTTGYLNLNFGAGAGAEIKVLCSECYETPMQRAGPGAKRQKGDRTDHRNGQLYGPQDKYITREGLNVYEPFWLRTFRYVRLEVTTRDQALCLNRFSFRETHYPLEVESKIQISPEIDKMWEISLNTLRNCMHETYEDCPFYEQNQFAMDSRLQILFTYQISRDDRLARKTIHEFHASRRDDGLLIAHFPSPGRCVNIPNFSLFWIIMLHDHMKYFGDAALIKEYIATADGILNYFNSLLNDQGLIGQFDVDDWGFVDWVKEWQGTTGLHSMGIPPAYHDGAATVNSLIYSWTLQQAADLCDFIKRCDTAAEYRSRATVVNEAVNRHCFDGKSYQDGSTSTAQSQHCQVFGILSGAIKGLAAGDLMRRVLKDSNMPRCSYALSFYMLRAATKAETYEETFQKISSQWEKMIEDNLTTWAEDDVSFRSDCHGWSSSPIFEVVAEFFGLSPLEGSPETLRLAPRKKLLTSTAKGTFVTKHGTLDIAVEGDSLVLVTDFDGRLEYVFGPKATQHVLRKGSRVVLPFGN